MITHAQERFEQDYKIVRKLLLTGEISGVRRLRLWVREKGAQALIAAQREIECNPKLKRQLSRQSGYQTAQDDFYNHKDTGEKE